MKFEKLYDKEKSFLLLRFFIVLFLLSIILLYSYKSRNKNSFENMLERNDYNGIYSLINGPDFSMEVFKTYMKDNYGKSPQIIEKDKYERNIVYHIYTVKGLKDVSLKKTGRRYLWYFDDYVNDWRFKVPKNAKVFIQNVEYPNRNGEVYIKKIPNSIYNVRICIGEIVDFNQRVAAGQDITIIPSIKPEVIKKCSDIVNEYINFRQDSINSLDIKEINCIDKSSGIYKEVIDEVEWLKKADYKINKSIVENNIIDSSINDSDQIILKIRERWNIKITSEMGVSEKIDDILNVYYINTNDNYIISQIKTKWYSFY